MVVGGGPAGLRAGAMAAARGHEVTVHERRTWAGGHLGEIAWLPTREGWDVAIEDLVAELEHAGGELRLGSEVDRALVEVTVPDVVLVATGATWDRDGASSGLPSGIDRVEGSGILGLDAALVAAREDPASLGARVVIADEGGTYPPLGLAEALAATGTRVTYLTAGAEIGADTAFLLERQHLMPRLRALHIELLTDRAARSFAAGTVETIDLFGGEPTRIEGVATLVLALGRSPRDELAAALADLATEVRVLGDARVPRTTTAVLEEAEKVGLDI
jgi:thioredoxin reductase